MVIMLCQYHRTLLHPCGIVQIISRHEGAFIALMFLIGALVVLMVGLGDGVESCQTFPCQILLL